MHDVGSSGLLMLKMMTKRNIQHSLLQTYSDVENFQCFFGLLSIAWLVVVLKDINMLCTPWRGV